MPFPDFPDSPGSEDGADLNPEHLTWVEIGMLSAEAAVTGEAALGTPVARPCQMLDAGHSDRGERGWTCRQSYVLPDGSAYTRTLCSAPDALEALHRGWAVSALYPDPETQSVALSLVSPGVLAGPVAVRAALEVSGFSVPEGVKLNDRAIEEIREAATRAPKDPRVRDALWRVALGDGVVEQLSDEDVHRARDAAGAGPWAAMDAAVSKLRRAVGGLGDKLRAAFEGAAQGLPEPDADAGADHPLFGIRVRVQFTSDGKPRLTKAVGAQIESAGMLVAPDPSDREALEAVWIAVLEPEVVEAMSDHQKGWAMARVRAGVNRIRKMGLS